MRRRAPILVAVATLAMVLAGQSFAGSSSDGKKVTVARGKIAHDTWSLAVQGRRHRRCYYLSLHGTSASSTIVPCRSDRERPPLWSRLGGASDNDAASIELDVTRNRVHSMRLRIGHPRSDRPSEWIRVRNRRLTRREAHQAGVRRNFRFAVLQTRGTLCVKKVVLFNREDQRIDKRRVPCEF